MKNAVVAAIKIRSCMASPLGQHRSPAFLRAMHPQACAALRRLERLAQVRPQLPLQRLRRNAQGRVKTARRPVKKVSRRPARPHAWDGVSLP